ncbi:MAG: nicotinamide-nucleotide amidohydrolase family protein [Gemmatimonadota bacterium]|nr:nicotinamide-nucleotide amidohydrolase family protein [Gemmatimonadota bacterium]
MRDLAARGHYPPGIRAARARELASRLSTAAVAGGMRVATAESCTGGLLSAALTDVPGASAYYAGGVVAYADDVKVRHLGVDPDTLSIHGAVSETVALQMAAGACRRFAADVAMAVTGIAGPGGGTPEKPVGTVWMAVGTSDGSVSAKRMRFRGDRTAVRGRSVEKVLSMALEVLTHDGL